MYKSHRYGVDATPWGYDIPVMEPGTYTCTVHFAETYAPAFEKGKRVFDLTLATSFGEPVVFDNIDIFAELDGAEFTVLTKTAIDLVVPGVLAIRVKPSEGNAIISGITCKRTGDLPSGVAPDFDTDPNIPIATIMAPTHGEIADPGPVIIGTEININAGGPAIGRFLAEDFAWIFGDTSQWGGPEGIEIGGAEQKNTPALISQRYGVDGATWGYNIPIEMPGLYNCSLHFAETDSASFEKGARVFDVAVMEQNMKGIDVFADASNAPFTSVVKTFADLKIGHELRIEFTPVVGNAFLSAITCEKTGDLDEDDPLLGSGTPNDQVSESPENGRPTPEPTPIILVPIVDPPTAEMPELESSAVATPLVESSESPIVESPSAETPVDGGLEEVIPSPTPALPTDIVTVTPAPGDMLEGTTDESSEPSLEPLSGDGLVPPDQDLATVDPALTSTTDQVVQNYKLLGTVSDGGNFTTEMKDALLSVSKSVMQQPSTWAMTYLQKENIAAVTRQSAASYQIDLQALHVAIHLSEETKVYSGFISKKKVNEELRKLGVDNLVVKLREEPELAVNGTNNKASSTTTTSTVVGIIVGCVLGLLVIVAVGAFVVVRRNRQSDPSANDFDGPPPAMTESEMSSVMERSETQASIEYLDDDSTFTAATSRAGDHVDQVAFDKDVFGRGTAAGSHGVS